eukprot:1500876-Prymnesium_polylepis.1
MPCAVAVCRRCVPSPCAVIAAGAVRRPIPCARACRWYPRPRAPPHSRPPPSRAPRATRRESWC